MPGLVGAMLRDFDPRVAGACRGSHSLIGEALPQEATLRLLSFNMQAGMAMTHLHHYVTRSWRHFLPSRHPRAALDAIADLLRRADIVALQEVDAGSLRSGFINQLQHLAQHAGFRFQYQQINRDLGHLGQYANGLLSRLQPYRIEDHQLPGLRGRGAILAAYGDPADPLLVLNLHLALTGRARDRQLAYVHALIGSTRRVLLLGDLNCTHQELLRSPLGDMDWQWAYGELDTYPSWDPVRRIDHILASKDLTIAKVQVLDQRLSDHRPVYMEVKI